MSDLRSELIEAFRRILLAELAQGGSARADFIDSPTPYFDGMVNLPSFADAAMSAFSLASADDISQEDAQHVLWFFRGGEGYRPGSFTESLISTMAKADNSNLTLLMLAYPGLCAAVSLAKNSPTGIETLRWIADGRAES